MSPERRAALENLVAMWRQRADNDRFATCNADTASCALREALDAITPPTASAAPTARIREQVAPPRTRWQPARLCGETDPEGQTWRRWCRLAPGHAGPHDWDDAAEARQP